MRKTETRTTRTFTDDTGIDLLLTEARMEERRGRADVFAARLEKLAGEVIATLYAQACSASPLAATAA